MTQIREVSKINLYMLLVAFINFNRKRVGKISLFEITKLVGSNIITIIVLRLLNQNTSITNLTKCSNFKSIFLTFVSDHFGNRKRFLDEAYFYMENGSIFCILTVLKQSCNYDTVLI